MKRLWLPLLLFALISAACRIGITPTEVPLPEPTEAPLATLAPSPTARPAASATPRPAATATRAATATAQAAASATPAATPLKPTPIVLPPGGESPALLTGGFEYSNGFAVETYYVEQAVALVDLYGFVTRDREWEIPVDGQILGFLSIDTKKQQGSFRLQLPLVPQGTYFDFTRTGKAGGVQVYVVAYWPNLTGGPFSEGDDRSRGWPSYLVSTVNDTENNDEVIGGKIVVWAPDAQQQFPTGYGPDGLLFTKDDPLGALPAGYTVIDLDQKPFAQIRELNPKIALYEPKDVAIKDYSADSYSVAFQKLVDFLKKNYAFSGIAGKAPEWDQLTAEIMPRVKAAEAKKDATAYFEAIYDFSLAFKDGHVGVSGSNAARSVILQRISGGYGFAIRELDDGRALVVFVTKNSPAQSAGMDVGSEILEFNGMPIKEAIGKAKVISPESSDFSLRYEQARILLRAPLGTEVKVTFKTSTGASKTATLRAVDERTSYYATSVTRNAETAYLPVDFKILDSGAGYVRINSNYDDLNLLVRLFERALKTFKDEDVDSLIIDMRVNSGGSPLGLAGFLTDKPIPLGILQYYSDKTGKFEADREQDKFEPNLTQYNFSKMALLVDMACYSACEIDAYGFSKVPGMQVVGMYPTGGVEAEVARGQFTLPAGISAQFPTGRFVNADGSLFLEGQGVKPTVRVPVTAANVLSQDDVVLQAAEEKVK